MDLEVEDMEREPMVVLDMAMELEEVEDTMVLEVGDLEEVEDMEMVDLIHPLLVIIILEYQHGREAKENMEVVGPEQDGVETVGILEEMEFVFYNTILKLNGV